MIWVCTICHSACFKYKDQSLQNLTTSLVNKMLKFQMHCMRKRSHFLTKKERASRNFSIITLRQLSMSVQLLM